MKTLKQIIKTAERSVLTEEIAQINDTGVLTEDLVTMVETYKTANWSEGMSGGEAKAQLKKLLEAARNAS